MSQRSARAAAATDLRNDRDPDRASVRRSALRIGWQVAATSAALVVVIIGLVIVYVIWQSTPPEQVEAHPADATRIYVDRDDLLLALAAIGLLAVALAGAATWVIARRAVAPIGEAMRIQRTFVADASHELRTPLTVLHARVQQLERRMADDDPNRGVVHALRDDTHALVAIVDDLLAAATADPTADHPDAVTPVDPEVMAVAQDLRVLADARSIRIEHTPTGAVVAVPAVAFRRCVLALVDNAIAHSPDDTAVEITVVVERTDVRVLVRDHGAGIVGIAPSRVFDRFAHGRPAPAPADTHRTGYGIGLALVREVAARYGGAVTVSETGPSGTTFALTMPSASPARPGQRRGGPRR